MQKYPRCFVFITSARKESNAKKKKTGGVSEKKIEKTPEGSFCNWSARTAVVSEICLRNNDKPKQKRATIEKRHNS